MRRKLGEAVKVRLRVKVAMRLPEDAPTGIECRPAISAVVLAPDPESPILALLGRGRGRADRRIEEEMAGRARPHRNSAHVAVAPIGIDAPPPP